MAMYDDDSETLVEKETKEPSMYKVLLHNDDFTPMEFVVDVLVKIFSLDVPTATKKMYEVHRNGKSVVAHYTFDLAHSKVQQVHKEAKAAGFPLRSTCEPS